jgi:hypothetical protein
MGSMRLRGLTWLRARIAFSGRPHRVLRWFRLGLPVARDVAILILTVLAIYIAYRDYLKTDIRLAITAPATGSVVLNKEISVEGTVSGGPYNGFEVHHRAPGAAETRLVKTVQESEEQMNAPVFPIPLSLTNEDGVPVIGRHTVTVTLKFGNRNVQQDSVSFDVVDCSLVLPPEFAVDKPIHDSIDLRPDEEVPGYEFLYYIDGIQWTLGSLDPAYLEDGYHDLRIAAVVRGGEEEVDSVTTNFVVDNSAPLIDSIGLSDGAVVSARSTLVPTVSEPHLAGIDLCVDDDLVGRLEGQALKERLARDDLGFTLETGWVVESATVQPETSAARDETGRLSPEDGWHNVLIRACDINGLCSTESARVLVDSTRPELHWSLPVDIVIPVLPTSEIWLGAMTPDDGARIVYSVGPPALIGDREWLDVSRCFPGSVHDVRATAIDQAGNVETRVAHFVVERSAQAWFNTMWRSVACGLKTVATPISDLADELLSEGLSIGIGTEVSSSLADESRLMWRGVFDFVFVEICPLLGRGMNGNTTMGVGFRVPLEGSTLVVPVDSLVHPVLGFGTAVTPNWDVLNSLGFGTEKVAETWVKLSLSTAITVPLLTRHGAALKLDVGPGCKLSFVQEFVREPVYSDGKVVGIRRFTQDTAKLEVTMDASFAFSAGRQR